MTNQSTIDKLIEMRLTSMSDAFITANFFAKLAYTGSTDGAKIHAVVPHLVRQLLKNLCRVT